MLWVGVALLCCITHGLKLSEDYFVGAVVEHTPISPTFFPVTREQAVDIMQRNLDIYEDHIRKAKQNGTQIIVFPEFGLYGDEFTERSQITPFLESIPDGGQNFIACGNNDTQHSAPILTRLSCLAQKYNLDIVVDMGDIQGCSNQVGCPPSGHFQFNSLVAFSREGVLLQKYHKVHLYVNESVIFDSPPTPTMRWFTSSFGVKFGMFVCFDIFYPFPAGALVNTGITHFVFASYWENDGSIPTMTASEVQQGWSRAHHSVLLAANIGTGYLDSGSGLYGNGVIYETFYNPSKANDEKLLVAKLPKDIKREYSTTQQNPKEVKEKMTKVWTNSGMEMVPFSAIAGLKSSVAASQGSVTCELSFEVSHHSNGSDTYAIMALDGTLFEGSLPTRLCGVGVCPNGNCEEFSIVSSTLFAFFELHATFEASSPVYPIVGQSGGELLSPGDVYYESVDSRHSLISQREILLLNAVLYSHYSSSGNL